ncbi:MAG: zf-TFIIB domain-containing protein [Longimicrobiales bacterium]
MNQLEARYSCPVCLGATLEKLPIDVGAVKGETRQFTLDHCPRCGGAWFDHGEVNQLRRVNPGIFWTMMARREPGHRMQCHNCHAHVARSQSKCGVCGWKIQLDCPICQKPMSDAKLNGLRLDVCDGCKGVWFDHDEISAIWQLQLDRLQRRGAKADLSSGAGVLLEALSYDPFLAYYGMSAAGHAVAGAAQALSHAPGALAQAPEVVAGAAQAAADVASSAFEFIVEIIAGIFDGF